MDYVKNIIYKKYSFLSTFLPNIVKIIFLDFHLEMWESGKNNLRKHIGNIMVMNVQKFGYPILFILLDFLFIFIPFIWRKKMLPQFLHLNHFLYFDTSQSY